MRALLLSPLAWGGALAMSVALLLGPPTASLSRFAATGTDLAAHTPYVDMRPNTGPPSAPPAPFGALAQHTAFFVSGGTTPEMTAVSPADARVFVNGISVGPRGAGGTPGAPLQPGSYLIPPHFLHEGVNRIDVIMARHGSLDAPPFVALGPEAVLRAGYNTLQRRIADVRILMTVLALSACVLCAAAALSHTIVRWWAAAAFAVGLAFIPHTVLQLTPTLDPVLRPALLVVAGAFGMCGEIGAARRWRGRLLLGAAPLAVALALALWFALAPGLAVVAAGALVLAAMGGWALFIKGREAAPLAGLCAGSAILLAVSVADPQTGLAATFAYAAALALLIGSLGAWCATSAFSLGEQLSGWFAVLARQNRMIEHQRSQLAEQASTLEEAIKRRAVLEERERFSREIHDGLGGNLLSLLLQVRGNQMAATAIVEELEHNLDELRLMIDSLDHTERSLSAALSTFHTRVSQQFASAGVRLEWRLPEENLPECETPDVVLNVYRILQEAATNIIRHSGASTASFLFDWDAPERQLRITIRDDGVGGAGAAPAEERKRGGLKNMADRIRAVGGSLDVDTASVKGWELRIALPV